MQKNKKESSVFLVGSMLIGLVFLITFIRSGIGNDKPVTTPLSEIPLDYPIIYTTELNEKIKQSASIQVVDLRDPIDFKAEHIVDSINIPIENLQKEGDILDSTKETILVTYTDNKEKISDAVRLLKNNGFKNVSVLYNGIVGWKAGLMNTTTDGNPNSLSDQSKVFYISPEELKSLFNDNSSFFILDVRTAESFKIENIHDSRNIPFSELESRKGEISKFKEIIVYGQDAIESFQGGSKLFDLGFFTVKTLDGGFAAWKESVSQSPETEKPTESTPTTIQPTE